MLSMDPGLFMMGVGAVALVGGFSARRYSWGVGLMYVGILVLLGTMLKMIISQMA